MFCEQRAPGNLISGQTRSPASGSRSCINLRMDPYERADITSDQYYDWLVKNVYLTAQATMKAAAFLETFVAYPPRQRPASFSVDQIMEDVMKRIEQEKQKR